MTYIVNALCKFLFSTSCISCIYYIAKRHWKVPSSPAPVFSSITTWVTSLTGNSIRSMDFSNGNCTHVVPPSRTCHPRDELSSIRPCLGLLLCQPVFFQVVLPPFPSWSGYLTSFTFLLCCYSAHVSWTFSTWPLFPYVS